MAKPKSCGTWRRISSTRYSKAQAFSTRRPFLPYPMPISLEFG